jgi:dynein heavy chain
VSQVISKVGEKAGKEYQIEQALDKMSSEWENVNLFIDAYRETGTFILKGVDDLQTLLDEHVTMTQAMQFSAFKKPFEDRIDRCRGAVLVTAVALLPHVSCM